MLQWKEFMSFGAQVPDEALEHRVCQLAPNKCCMLIYTVIAVCHLQIEYCVSHYYCYVNIKIVVVNDIEHFAFSALTLLIGRQEECQACKN